jgi:tRNA 2-thiouridine synthesizing protein A
MDIPQNHKGERDMRRLARDVMLSSIPAVLLGVIVSLVFYCFLTWVG